MFLLRFERLGGSTEVQTLQPLHSEDSIDAQYALLNAHMVGGD